MPFRLPTLLTTAAVLAVAAPAAQAASPIAVEQHASTVTSAQDAIAWSSYDAGRYRLKLDRAGTVSTPAVATSKTAFDVDLGTSSTGALVAVYSRAGQLYRYDVAAGTEAKLDVAVKGAKLSQPAIQSGRLAFVARKGGRDTLYLRTGGATKAVFSAESISDPQLSGTRLAFVTTSGVNTLHRIETLHVQTLSGHPHAVYSARSGGANAADIVGPGFDASGTHLYWARRNLGSGSGNRYVRLTLATGRTGYAIGTDKIYSVSWVDPAQGFATAQIANPGDDDASAPGDGVVVQTTGALAFTAKP